MPEKKCPHNNSGVWNPAAEEGREYTNEDARIDLRIVRDSCSEGLSGVWDCSTDEGRKGFEPMIELLDRVAKHYGIKFE